MVILKKKQISICGRLLQSRHSCDSIYWFKKKRILHPKVIFTSILFYFKICISFQCYWINKDDIRVPNTFTHSQIVLGPSWSSSYGSWNYNYLCNQYLSPLKLYVHVKMYSIQHYVIKFVSDLRQVGGFRRVLMFPPPIKKTDRHEITYILLKVALNTITLTLSTHLHTNLLYSFIL